MNTTTIRLFDANHDFASDFDEKIEQILMSVHGENYYDIDEEYEKAKINLDVEKIDNKIEDIADQNPDMKINIVSKSSKKISIKDFVPILFFIIMFLIILFAGYYFLNHFDISSLLNR